MITNSQIYAEKNVVYIHPAGHEIHDGMLMLPYLIIGINLITVYRPQTSNVTSTSRAIRSSVPGKAMTLAFFDTNYCSLSHAAGQSLTYRQHISTLHSDYNHVGIRGDHVW